MHSIASWSKRAAGKVTRTLATHLHRREAVLRGDHAIVSFTFDDAPRSAFTTGADILEEHGAHGTFYMSLSLLSTTSEVGLIASPSDLRHAIGRGHELGCHTYDHCDAWFTSPQRFISSVDRNRQALGQLLPGYTFQSFAYPKSGATAAVKPYLAQRFSSCRGGGQTFNAGTVDLNHLKACFIDRRANPDLGFVGKLIEENARLGGWLIFAAHDVSDSNAPFSCTADFLKSVVRLAVGSGAQVLPVSAACSRLSGKAET